MSVRGAAAEITSGCGGRWRYDFAFGLLMLAAWLISTAALHPSIAELQVAVVGVRFFGIMRSLWRYARLLRKST